MSSAAPGRPCPRFSLRARPPSATRLATTTRQTPAAASPRPVSVVAFTPVVAALPIACRRQLASAAPAGHRAAAPASAVAHPSRPLLRTSLAFRNHSATASASSRPDCCTPRRRAAAAPPRQPQAGQPPRATAATSAFPISLPSHQDLTCPWYGPPPWPRLAHPTPPWLCLPIAESSNIRHVHRSILKLGPASSCIDIRPYCITDMCTNRCPPCLIGCTQDATHTTRIFLDQIIKLADREARRLTMTRLTLTSARSRRVIMTRPTLTSA
ncbi:uncharacterized protein DKFZp434B061-like [Hordeum vulgare subsp. vulgare]|uniref:uncharacterized protein DKFZp434B061-like n=1 Tax=Hordeum vulgare subsp. vulgare TaxID=112509 RepID=UPI001D1A3E33|nr:uncharacterized protein DKFZp434B061-like [Hordeum vulgare subsp. vulgare]